MKRFKVIVPLLNVRSKPVSDFSIKEFIITTIPYGNELDLEEYPDVPNPSLGKWHTDGKGRFYWGGGLSVAPQVSESSGNLWMEELGIESIWSGYQEKGENAKVLILDSGINMNIPEMATAIIDPVMNFVKGSQTTKSIDRDFHGTHCASLISARSNTVFTGAAPGSKLYVAKITETGSLDDAVTINLALQEYLKDDYDFDIISISQELYNPDATLESLIKQHTAKDRLVIACIGNDYAYQNRNFSRYPGALEDCFSVGSCTNERALSTFTMNPSKAAIFCYGEEIFAYQDNNIPGKLSGTSQATAIVAGICALVISWLKKNHFSYTPKSVRDLLIKNSDTLSGAPEMHVINAIKTFNKLQTYNQNGNKDLQSCIDADSIGV